jgi:threonyl-tRNA synthetase
MAEYDADVSTDPLYVLRHSTAHVLAAAVTQLFPEAKYAGGPPIENGFYYDFDLPRPLSEEDLGRIEEKMAEIVARGDRFEQELLPHPEAVRRFTELGQPYKLYWVNQKASEDELVSCYRTGEFFDLCRGPHLESAADIPAFKLMRVAGAYWLGDERN